MPNETDKIIEKHLESLPAYVKDAFAAAKPFEKIRKISAELNLHVDEAEKLEQEVLLIMLGLASPNTFIEETSRTFGLSEENVGKLVDRVSLELFMPIRDAMQKYMEELAESEGAVEISAPQAVAETPLAPPQVTAPTIFHAPLPVPHEDAAVAPAILPTTLPKTVEKPVSAVNPADAVLKAPQSSTPEKVTVGISPAKNTYKVDPYLEPPV